MHICVVGVGYVGLVTGTCFAEFGVNVTCVDNDPMKIDGLNNGRIPIYEPGLEELVNKNLREGLLRFTTDIEEGIQQALVVFIAVGTPSSDDGGADLRYVEEVAATIGQKMNGYKVVVTKSTVPVGTGRRIQRIIKENQSQDHSFDMASNPEFLREGSAIEDFMRPNRVVLGATSEQAVAILKDLYRPLNLIEVPFVITNLETAELIKYAANAFLATKISFINEMANICELVGADVHQVAIGMGLDNRIGRKFLHPGPGFGGSCFPKDTRAVAHLAREWDYEFKIVNAVVEVNESQQARMVSKIEKALGGFAGQTVCMLGLTFKPNTDDIREAPAIYICRELLGKGLKIQAYDPAGMIHASQVLPEIDYRGSLYEAAEGADAVVIVTEWNQFRNIDWNRVKKSLKRSVVVDLRNIYDPGQMTRNGFEYHCVGRCLPVKNS